MRRYDLCVFALLAACFAGKAVAQDGSVVVQAGEGSYTCEDATRLKTNFAEYQKLSSEQQMQVDVQWQMCKPENNEPGAEKAAVIVRSKDKIGFGILGEKDIKHFRQHCNNINTGANAVLSVDEPVLGPLVAIGSKDVCNGIAEQMGKNNSLVLLAPGALIGAYSLKSASAFVLSPADAKNVSNAIDKFIAKAPKVSVRSVSKQVNQTGKDIRRGAGNVARELGRIGH